MEDSGLIYLRNRYYDPSIGAFINEDPIRDGLNWYSYCSGNPVAFVDPLGLEKEAIYYFYESDFKKDAEKNVKLLQKEYPDAIIHSVETDTPKDFMFEWNWMGNLNGENVTVKAVIVDLHGSVNSMITKDEKGYDHKINTKSLKPKKIDVLLLLCCNSGHFDSRFTCEANELLQQNEVNTVIAADGSPTSYNFFNPVSYKVKNSDDFKAGLADGYTRKPLGFIAYSKDSSNQLQFKELGIKFDSILDILKGAGY